jgi:hypothetical protein
MTPGGFDPGKLNLLATLMQPGPPLPLAGMTLRQCGLLRVWTQDAALLPPRHRRLTLFSAVGCFAVLVDDFQDADDPHPQRLLWTPETIQGSGLSYRVGQPGRWLGLRLLGDYAARQEAPGQLQVCQDVPAGRFLILLSAEPAVRARPCNGWCIEVRQEGRVWHLLHSNQARKLRPVGPVLTDARYALVGQEELPFDAPAAPQDLHLDLIDSSQLQLQLGSVRPVAWGGNPPPAPTPPPAQTSPAPDWVI